MKIKHVLPFVLLLACDSDPMDPEMSGETGSTGAEAALEIIGNYADNFDGTHMISMEQWIYDAGEFGITTTTIMDFDNEAGWVAGEDATTAGSFSRFDWTTDEAGVLYYCQAAFDAASLEAALEAPRGDESDPSVAGCGGMFPWTTLLPS